jgi:preprotein translocase subunit SecD
VSRPGTSPKGQLHVGRYLVVLALNIAALYATVFLAGPGSTPLTPKLGLDLQGGASVVLTPVTDNGQAPRRDQLDTAVDIIQRRVNGLGVAEAEVVTQGNNIVVSVPGGTRDSLRSLAQTAQLRFREVLQALPGSPQAAQELAPSAVPSLLTPPSARPSGAVVQRSTQPSAAPQGRAVTSGLLAQASPAPAPAASAAPRPTPAPTPAPSGSAAPAGPRSGDPYTPQAFAALDCSDENARRGGVNDKPDQQIIACEADGSAKYQLDVAKVVGTDVDGATAQLDQQLGNEWQVVVDFTGAGQDKFTQLTTETIGKQVAIVLDGIVLSAPTIQDRIDSDAQITGNFTQKTSAELANTLKYGALPLSFQNSQVEVVSATLGDDQLRAGLLAGGLGLAIVVLYALLYYRVLGIVTILGLVVSGVITFAAVSILGDLIGFALSLAGIAGFIVAVGITADSFVVFFERLKDEIREGRTPRTAADRAWVRARRTILSANTVSFLSAIILYFLSVGSVRGFAFTLGLSTLIDVLVVFLFTRPLVSWLVRFRWFTNPTVSGMAVSKDNPPPTLTRPRRTANQEA